MSISPEKQGYKKEQPLECFMRKQLNGGFKAIRENLLCLVKDIDEGMINGNTGVRNTSSK